MESHNIEEFRFEIKGVVANVKYDSNRMSIRIDPTDSLEDLRRSLRRKPFHISENTYAHTGYWEAQSMILHKLIETFGPKKISKTSFDLFGFSMGGSIVESLAVSLIIMGAEINLLSTFGSPACLSKNMAAMLKAKAPGVRFLVDGDPIPNLWGGYHHSRNPSFLMSPSILPGFWNHTLKCYEQALRMQGFEEEPGI